MARFAEQSALADTGNTKANLKDYVEGLIPQSDLVITGELLVSGNKIGLADNSQRWVKYTKLYSDFSIAGTTSADKTVVALGAGSVVHAIKVITTTAFVGGSVSAANVSVGLTSSDPDDYINDQSVFTLTTTAGGEYSTVDFLTENASTSILCQLKTVSDNIDNLTAGAVDIWVSWSIADSGL